MMQGNISLTDNSLWLNLMKLSNDSLNDDANLFKVPISTNIRNTLGVVHELNFTGNMVITLHDVFSQPLFVQAIILYFHRTAKLTSKVRNLSGFLMELFHYTLSIILSHNHDDYFSILFECITASNDYMVLVKAIMEFNSTTINEFTKYRRSTVYHPEKIVYIAVEYPDPLMIAVKYLVLYSFCLQSSSETLTMEHANIYIYIYIFIFCD